ncbi:MAG: DUF4372 domain-containing protein [Acidobacteriaceae bacterium]
MNQVCSVFSQILQLFSRGEFERAVEKHKAERHAKGFTCWGQFVSMLFCQVARLKSPREVCMGLAGCESPLKHLGFRETPRRSTLARRGGPTRNVRGNSTGRSSANCWGNARRRWRHGAGARSSASRTSR